MSILIAAFGIAASPSGSVRSTYNVLYGYKIGQTLQNVRAELGKEDSIHKFPDGHKAYIYRRSDHVVVFQVDPGQPDRIWSIMVQGIANPADRGLDGVDLGMKESEVLARLGPPDSKRTARDGLTGKEAPGIFYWNYFDSSNFSLEFADGKLRSIKNIYRPETTFPPEPDLAKWVERLKQKNFARVCNALRVDAVFVLNGKSFSPIGSCLEFVRKEGPVRSVLFGPGGLGAGKVQDCRQVSLRVLAEGGAGPVIHCTINKQRYELLFVRSFEGWVLLTLSDSVR